MINVIFIYFYYFFKVVTKKRSYYFRISGNKIESFKKLNRGKKIDRQTEKLKNIDR